MAAARTSFIPGSGERAIILVGSALIVVLLFGSGGCDSSPPPPAAAPVVTETAIAAALEAVEQYFMGEDLDSAEAIAARLVERAPDDPRTREAYGRVLLRRGLVLRRDDPQRPPLLERAYAEYDAAASLPPPSAGLHQSAGSVAMEAGNRVAALDHYETAAALAPLDPQPRVFAAQLFLQDGRLDEARSRLERALMIDPDLAVAHASLAVIAMEEGDGDMARLHIATARRLEPGDPGLRAQEARIRRRTGDAAGGLALLAGLDSTERALLPVATEIAACAQATGDHGRAARAWAHRYETDPDAPDAWRSALEASRALLASGDRRAALSWVQKASALAPGKPEVETLEAEIRGGE